MYGLREALNRTTDPSPCTSTHQLGHHEIVIIIIIMIHVVPIIIMIFFIISEQFEKDCAETVECRRRRPSFRYFPQKIRKNVKANENKGKA